jgi:hypothetical protein
MITFETRWNPVTDMWQFRAPEGVWSEPMRLGALFVAMKREVTPPEELKGWSKPIAHATKRPKGSYKEAHDLYEIKGGKVQRIPFTRTEKDNQDLAELMGLLGD